jgi:hypothetical protein
VISLIRKIQAGQVNEDNNIKLIENLLKPEVYSLNFENFKETPIAVILNI